MAQSMMTATATTGWKRRRHDDQFSSNNHNSLPSARTMFVSISVLSFLLLTIPNGYHAAPISSSVSSSILSASSLYYSNLFHSPFLLSMISSSMNKVGANNNSNDNAKSATAASSITFTTSLPNLPPVGSSSSLTALTTTTIDQQQPIIEDALCRIEDLEQANDSQLYTILHELVQTTFFRTFLVNLNRKCPLQSWNMDRKQKQDPDLLLDQQSQIDVIDLDSNDEEEYQCDGGGAAEELDEDAEPLCTVAHEDDNMDNNNFLTSPFQKKEPSSSKHQQQSNPFESNALFSLSQGGYESKSQQDAFSWEDVTDQVEDDDDDENTNSGRRLLPDTFWNDMCRNLQVDVTPDDYSVNTNNGKSNVVNLLLNPEHNTGYNGTHIWRAIYEENCITKNDGDDSHMCLEERVLYRLLSGLHTSTTISIAMHYYPPSKRKNRHTWEPNPTYFMSKFEHNTEYIRNLHFSYAVLLRALHKASPFLYEYSSKLTNIYTSNTVDDETASILLRRLLDSSILKSCSNVFTAFDESLMFQEEQTAADENFSKDIMDVVSLQKNFKGVFHNVSSILDCVQCQQCKLHGKMAMLGYGTALKILFMDNHPPLLDRNEIVALINTIAKFSESIRNVRKLTQLYWMTQYEQQQLLVVQQQQLHSRTQPKQQQSQQTPNSSPSNSFIPVVAPTTALPSKTATASGATTNVGYKEDNSRMPINYVDTAIGLISSLGRADLIPVDREGELIQLALQRQPELLLLAKHYADDMNKFLKFSSSIPLPTVPVEPVVSSSVITPAIQDEQPDAIVIGSGLAGMAATLNILDRGGRVILLEKEHLLGGNSNKASSGINACCPNGTSSPTDSMTVFENDTIKSAGESARPDLISTLISNSGRAVEWLRTRVGVDLSLTSQLGGHTDKRTHRPNNGMVGAEIIYGMQKAVKAYEKLGQVKIIMKAKVTKLVTTDDGARVIGVQYVKTDAADDKQLELNAPNVILATGGFAADRSKGSYLDHYRPELVRMPTTAGTFSTGDGVTLATSLGAGVVDMDKVQVHPTGWVDPSDPENTSKTLAAELMRGVGGILLNDKGKRFCNELGTRSYVTEKMLSHNEQFVKTGKWNVESPIPTFSMILSSSAAADGAKKHVDLYTRKGLMTRLEGVAALAQWMGIPKSAVVSSLKEYQNDATTGKDSFGKTSFRNIPAKDLDNEIFYAGTVTPVLHYCMGGITIDTEGNVLNGETGDIIHGLHAAGEVTGGVHGVNRLAGNSLLECTVFGTIVGQKIPIHTPPMDTSNNSNDASTHTKSDGKLRSISMSELQRHNTPEDCWVAIHGVVYDLTLFADEHPAGSESIHELAGTDGTDAFDAVHNKGILDDFDEDRVGLLI